MLLNRDELIAILFRETDRAQRMKTPLAVIHCGVCDWEAWRGQEEEATLNGALRTIAERITQLLRCYDSVGQVAQGEMVLVLPGCNSCNASTMAERLNNEVFALPVKLERTQIQFHACFGVSASTGRSPFVVLRGAERALHLAKAQAAGSVYCSTAEAEPDPAEFLLPVLQDKWINS
ncbi:MAG TPA: diguanylate cyclase [Terracidiphilus sp.]|jgi:diguanylate cyclase (GGDEF)-like protein